MSAAPQLTHPNDRCGESEKGTSCCTACDQHAGGRTFRRSSHPDGLHPCDALATQGSRQPEVPSPSSRGRTPTQQLASGHAPFLPWHKAISIRVSLCLRCAVHPNSYINPLCIEPNLSANPELARRFPTFNALLRLHLDQVSFAYLLLVGVKLCSFTRQASRRIEPCAIGASSILRHDLFLRIGRLGATKPRHCCRMSISGIFQLPGLRRTRHHSLTSHGVKI